MVIPVAPTWDERGLPELYGASLLFVSVVDKRLGIAVSLLDAALRGLPGGIDSKWVMSCVRIMLSCRGRMGLVVRVLKAGAGLPHSKLAAGDGGDQEDAVAFF